MYTITITKTTIEERPAGKDWCVSGEKTEKGNDVWAYTPEIVKKKEVELKIYEQIVEELDLKAVIATVNRNPNTTVLEFHAGPEPGVDEKERCP